MQDTGYECDDRQFNSRLGFAGGFYGSCEPAGYIPTKAPGPWPDTAMLGRILFNGEGHFRMTGESSDFYEIENEFGWLAKNRRAIELVGKHLPVKPDIAVFFSSRSALLDPVTFWSAATDIGRGDLQRAHFDHVYLSDTMLVKGMAAEYSVLVDTNTRIMDRDVIAAIRAFVEKGGTFVAMHSSGRHGVLEADSWPIAELTGFTGLPGNERGNITFKPNLPIFGGMEGQEYPGEGIGFKSTGAGGVPLANWEDGSVAVGMRKLGKGKVILLGSTFWRQRPDVLERIFTDLGVKRAAIASRPDVYARKMITKNGLQEWLVVMNQTPADVTADVGFVTAQKPTDVQELLEPRSAVAFEFQQGWVTIKDVAFPPYATRIFAIKRADLSAGIDFWWKEKIKYWKSSGVAPAPDTGRGEMSNPSAIPFETWKFYADTENKVGGSNWAASSFSDATWRNLNNTPWNFQYGDLKDYSGVGLYRSQPFSIPSDWGNRKITLNVRPGNCFKGMELYINGKAVAGLPRQHRKADITGMLKNDGNVLAIKLTGTTPISGLLGCAVWVQPELTLSPSASLLGEWDAVKADGRSSEKVTVAGIDRALTDEGYLLDKSRNRLNDEDFVLKNHLAVKASRMVRDIDVPNEWRGRNIYVRINSPLMNGQTLPLLGLGNGMLMINNQPIFFPHAPNTPLDDEMVNLTPFIKFGQKNRIELWPRTPSDGSQTEALIVVNNIEIGCEAK